MKHSVKCVDKALAIALPGCSAWPKSITRPTLLDMAAKEFFLYPDKFTSTENAYAVFVVRTALLELAEKGFMTFGTVDEFWM